MPSKYMISFVLTLLILGLQYKRNMWEGRYRHCLQAFQGFLSKLFKHRQDADSGYLICVEFVLAPVSGNIVASARKSGDSEIRTRH